MGGAQLTRIIWLTDLHLNFCSELTIERLYAEIEASTPDALLIGGDIDESTGLLNSLKKIERQLRLPVYFVLGNHDYYHGSIDVMRQEVTAHSRESQYLHWLPQTEVVPLTQEVCLIGHGGWADGRYGTYSTSNVMLNDYVLIEELAELDKNERLTRLKTLGDEAAACIFDRLKQALAQFKFVILLTHVPPFQEAAWHEGQISSPEFLPHFSCKAMGDILLQRMSGQIQARLLVLCGHTHSPGVAWPLPNVRVLTGAAKYGQPRIQRIFDLDQPSSVFSVFGQ